MLNVFLHALQFLPHDIFMHVKYNKNENKIWWYERGGERKDKMESKIKEEGNAFY